MGSCLSHANACFEVTFPCHASAPWGGCLLSSYCLGNIDSVHDATFDYVFVVHFERFLALASADGIANGCSQEVWQETSPLVMFPSFMSLDTFPPDPPISSSLNHVCIYHHQSVSLPLRMPLTLYSLSLLEVLLLFKQLPF